METDPKLVKPAPVPTATSEPYWRKAGEGTLTLQFCSGCDEYVFYPRLMCGRCNAPELEWRPVSGQGTVYTFAVVHRAPSPEFRTDVPYVVGLIDLDEGVRMMTAILGEPEEVSIGSRVAVDFELRGSFSVPVFRLRGPTPGPRA